MKKTTLLSGILVFCIIPTAFIYAEVHLTQADSLDKAKRHMYFGVRNLKAKEYENAQTQLHQAWLYFPLQEKTKRSQCARYLGRYYQEIEQFDDAVTWYEIAIKVQPNNKYNKLAYHELADIHTHQQRPAKAIEAYKALLASPTASIKTEIGYLYNITMLNIEQENYEQALQSAKEWSQLAPDDPQVKELLSKLHMRTGGQDEAIAEMEHMLQINPGDTETLEKLADIYAQQNNHDKAYDAYSRLHETDKENYLYLEQMYKLGHQLQKSKTVQLSTLKKMHQLHPENVWVIESIADMTEDIVWIKKGLKLDPTNGRLLYLMGGHHYNRWQKSNAPTDSLQAFEWYTKTLENIQWKDQAQQMLNIINPPKTKQDSIAERFWNDPKSKQDTVRTEGKK